MIAAAAAMVGPIFIAVWAIVAELKLRRFRAFSHASEVISEDDKAELDKWDARLAQTSQRMEAILTAGAARGVHKRADGWFDDKSPGAHELNGELQELAHERARLVASRSAFTDRLAARRESWLEARAGVISARVALVVFVCSFAFITGGHLILHDVDLHDADMNLPVLMFGARQDSVDRMIAAATSTVVAAVAVLITRSIARKSLA
jgi:hypothetical protein